MYKFFFCIALLGFLVSCQNNTSIDENSDEKRIFPDLKSDRYNVAFLIMDGVYNTEFTAPFDIFQHTQFRKGIKAMNTFTVANTLEPITSFEGVRVLPDFDYTKDSIPRIDILVVPSAEHHLDTDLKDTVMLNFVKKVDKTALFMTSHCDGAFVLAKAGLLDDVVSTTFPSDIDTYGRCFPILRSKIRYFLYMTASISPLPVVPKALKRHCIYANTSMEKKLPNHSPGDSSLIGI